MTSKPKNKNPEGPQEPKRHIVLPGKTLVGMLSSMTLH
jgi:hypothetical protein